MPGMEQIRLPRKNRHKAVSPEVYWDLTAQKSVQSAETKCGTAVEKNEEWTIRPAALTIATTGVCIHSFVRYTAWIVVRISRSGAQHCNLRRTTTADTFRR